MSDSSEHQPALSRASLSRRASAAAFFIAIFSMVAVCALYLPLAAVAKGNDASGANGDTGARGATDSLPEVDKVVIVIMDRVTMAELDESTTFRPLLKRSQAGLISSPVAGAPRPPKFYLSLGAGDIAGGNWRRENAYGVHERFQNVTGGELYAARSGRQAPDAGVVETDIFAIIRASETLPRMPRPGGLGDALEAAGKRRAMVGDADIIDPSLRTEDPLPHREAALILMDGRGTVPYAVVGEDIDRRDPTFLPGLRTDSPLLRAETVKALRSADVVALTLGDTYRVSAYAGTVSTERVELLKKQAIEESGTLLRDLVQDVRRAGVGSTRFILLSPTPPRRSGRYLGMPPVIIFGDAVSKGVLGSSTTRRQGVVANLDIAPTVLSWLGITHPAHMPGRAVTAIEGVPGGSVVSGLVREEERTAGMFLARPPAVSVFLAIFLLLFLTAAYLGYRGRESLRQRRWIRIGALFAMSSPLGFLLASYFAPPTPAILLIAASLTVSALLAFTASAGRRLLNPVVTIGAATVVAVLIDVTGGPGLLYDTVLGYSPLYGARYYGIGNEMMSITVAAAVTAVAISGGRSRTALVVIGVAFAALIAFIGHPALGANVGGTVTACVASGVALISWARGRVGTIGVIAVVAFTFLVLAAFTAIDLSRVDVGSSHLGNAGGSVVSTGLSALLPIVARKIAAGLSISTDWAMPVGLLVGAAWAAWRLQSQALIIRVNERYPLFRGGVIALTAAAVAGFLTNDSGLIIPGLIAVFLGSVAVALLADEGAEHASEEAVGTEAEAGPTVAAP